MRLGPIGRDDQASGISWMRGMKKVRSASSARGDVVVEMLAGCTGKLRAWSTEKVLSQTASGQFSASTGDPEMAHFALFGIFRMTHPR